MLMLRFYIPRKKFFSRGFIKGDLNWVNLSVDKSSCCKTLKRVGENCKKFWWRRVSGKCDNVDAQHPRYNGMGSL